MTEVTEKMVEAAFYAFCKSRTGDGKSNAYSMRDAIEAALAAREPVNAGKLAAELREHARDWHREPWSDSDAVMTEAAAAIEEMVEALHKIKSGKKQRSRLANSIRSESHSQCRPHPHGSEAMTVTEKMVEAAAIALAAYEGFEICSHIHRARANIAIEAALAAREPADAGKAHDAANIIEELTAENKKLRDEVEELAGICREQSEYEP